MKLFLSNVTIIKTKVPLPEAYVTLADLVKHFRFLLICMVFQHFDIEQN